MTKEEKRRKKAVRKTDGKKKKPVLPVIIFTVILISLAAFFAIPTIIQAGRENIPDFGVQTGRTVEKGSNFLFTPESGETGGIYSLSGTGVISSGSSYISFDRQGRIISQTRTGYSSSSMKHSGKRYIVFERSTGKYTLMDKNGSVYSSQLDGEIINAAASSGGNYVIISRKTLATSLLTVYSYKNEILFQWECNDGYLTDCAISSDGKKIAAVLFDVENGTESSEVLTFTIKSTDVEQRISGESVVYSVRFINGSKIGILTDKKYIVADFSSGETVSADYEYDTLSKSYLSENGYTAVLKSDFGSIDSKNITVFDRKAKVIFDREIGNDVTDFCIDRSFVYVMTPGKIILYALSSGEEHSSVETVGGLKYINVISGKIFCAAEDGLYMYER